MPLPTCGIQTTELPRPPFALLALALALALVPLTIDACKRRMNRTNLT